MTRPSGMPSRPGTMGSMTDDDGPTDKPSQRTFTPGNVGTAAPSEAEVAALKRQLHNSEKWRDDLDETAAVLDELQIAARTPGHPLEAPAEDVDAKATWERLSDEERKDISDRRRDT